MKPDWKRFQDLVAQVEHVLAGTAAIVKSPDRVLDRLTGQPREIDATIRVPTGSTDVLIAIECRHHKTAEDVTWIEQLATKRENIGADVLIAVSSHGFTSPARELAEAKNIRLRDFRDITEDEIVSEWLIGFEVGIETTDYQIRGVRLHSSGVAVEEARWPIELIRSRLGLDVPFAREVGTDRVVTLRSLATRVDDRDIPIGGPPQSFGCRFTFPGKQIVLLNEERTAIDAIEFSIALTRRTDRVPLRIMEYGTPERAHLQVAGGTVPLGDGTSVGVHLFLTRGPGRLSGS